MITAPSLSRALPEWLFRPVVPSVVAAALTLAAGLAALHLYTVALWSEQQQALRLLTDAVLAISDQDTTVAPYQLAEALGLQTRSAVVRIPHDTSCAAAAQAAIADMTAPAARDDLAGLGEAVCRSGHPAAASLTAMSGFVVATPVLDGFHRIVALRILETNGRPAPTPADVIGQPAGLAIVAAIAGIAGGLAYQWGRATRLRLERLLREASFDGLTRALRREAFLGELAAAMADPSRPLSVLVVDVDRLKPTNDSYGHRTGDEVLRTVADIIRNGLRSGDIVGRLGGDEFAALMRGVDAQQAAVAAERIRARVETACAEVNGAPVQVTVSIGVAERRFSDDPKSLLERGDLNLYTAKRNSRNRVVIVN